MGTFRRIETITPLLVFPLIAYVIIAVIAGGQHMDETPAIAGNLNATLFSVPMVSGVSWKMRLGDIFEQLEKAGADGDMEPVEELFDQVLPEMAAVKAFASDYTVSHTG